MTSLVLILVVVDNGLVLEANADTPRRRQWVLILIVVDNGLVQMVHWCKGWMLPS